MNNIVQLLSSISPWFIAKIFSLIILALYIFLSGIVLRQADLMNQVLEVKFSPVIHLLAVINLIAVIILFFLALIIL